MAVTCPSHLSPWFGTHTGHLPGGFPYVHVDGGPRTLVVLPGVGDAMWWGRYPPSVGPAVAAYFYQYLNEHEVYLLSRPRGLPEGHSVAESADDHAQVLRDIGPVDVLGISFGGLIGQQLCVRHPDIVDRLVIADSAYRLATDARQAAQRMVRYATDRDWFSLRADLARGLFSDWRQFAYPPLIQTIGRFSLPRPADPEDVRISLQAILEYNGRGDLERIAHSTLVIGGSEDPYFTAECMRQTAAGIPDATLSLIRGAKHGAFHERKCTFDRRTTAFLTTGKA